MVTAVPAFLFQFVNLIECSYYIPIDIHSFNQCFR